MSFSFNFDSEDLGKEDNGRRADDAAENEASVNGQGQGAAKETKTGTARRHTLAEMMDSLPLQVSYSRIEVPAKGKEPLYIYRRDLFDARFQMLHEEDDEDDDSEGDTKAEAKQWKDVMAGAATDLVPGVYEGGLKTWECSLDLASIVHSRSAPAQGDARVLELGCGTAIPSLAILSAVLSGKDQQSTMLQLCDFNEQVLRLVTLPNLILTWYFSRPDPGVNEIQGDLELNEELLGQFTSDLSAKRVSLEFYSGHWDGLEDAGVFAGGRPTMILTSETIYSMDTMPLLIDTLERAMRGSLEDHLQNTDLSAVAESGKEQRDAAAQPACLCLVAAKILYFGVGGGVYAFEQELRRRRGHADTIWKSEGGVGRVVLRIEWP